MMKGICVVVLALALVSVPVVHAQEYGTAEETDKGYGCYNEIDHTCDCEATVEDCDGTEGSFWTDLCGAKCDAPEEATVVAGCLKMPSEDGSEHGGCSCSTPLSYCEEQGHLVTESCACFVGTFTSLSLSLSRARAMTILFLSCVCDLSSSFSCSVCMSV